MFSVAADVAAGGVVVVVVAGAGAVAVVVAATVYLAVAVVIRIAVAASGVVDVIAFADGALIVAGIIMLVAITVKTLHLFKVLATLHHQSHAAVSMWPCQSP